MENRLSTNGHEWSEHEIQVAGQNYFYRQCRLCRQEFVRTTEKERWRAAIVGVSRLTVLDEITNALWSSEECPGIRTARLINTFSGW
jgi:hypothetical protein